MRLWWTWVLALAAGAAHAEEAAQVEWQPSFEAALAASKQSGRPVMICINSRDGEHGDEYTLTKIYKNARFAELSKRFVMVVISGKRHKRRGPCPRFGQISCKDHMACYEALFADYKQLEEKDNPGHMISPQHVFLSADGELLRRKKYLLGRPGLVDLMRSVASEYARSLPGDRNPDSAPLDDRDRADLERVRAADAEARSAALTDLLFLDKRSAVVALVELAGEATLEVQRDVLRALGASRRKAAHAFVADYLAHKDPVLRSASAICLERGKRPESVAPLLKRLQKEREAQVRKNLYRALGACGGPAADAKAARALVKGMREKELWLSRHAVLSMNGYRGDGAKLVCKPLERAALKERDPDRKLALVYTLAYVGNEKTTLPVLTKIYDRAEAAERWYVMRAIDVLRGKPGGFGGTTVSRLYREDEEDPARKR